MRFLNEMHSALSCKDIFGFDCWKTTTRNKLNQDRLRQIDDKIEAAVDKLISMVRDKFNKMKLEPNGKVRMGGFGQRRTRTVNLGDGEELLERLISLTMDNVRNQFNLMSGLTKKKYDHDVKKMDVDLIVLSGEDKIKEMIELKISTNLETPISAMFQILSYYLFFQEAAEFCRTTNRPYPDVTKRVRLTILAPEKYYIHHLGEIEGWSPKLNAVAKRAYTCMNRKYTSEGGGKISPLSFKKIKDFKENKINEYKEIVTEIRENCTSWTAV